MQIAFAKGSFTSADASLTRVHLAPKPLSYRALVREGKRQMLEIGVGDPKALTLRQFRILARSVITFAKQQGITALALDLNESLPPLQGLQSVELAHLLQTFAENVVMANFEFTQFKTKPKEGWKVVEKIALFGKSAPALVRAIEKGVLVGEAVNACRVLANTPGGDMTPTTLARAAKEAAKGLPIKVTTLNEATIKKEGMGAILGVAKGSSEPPTFTIMEYRPRESARSNNNRGPIVIAGKGVTFDSGGLNVKGEAGMYEMHLDMSGAAAVISAVTLAAKLKLKKHVIGLIPAVENMSGGSAYRPGDILKSLSGKTIEVLNTDAEGRLILADALTYAKRFRPSVVLDVATLTGAALGALGQHANALLTRDDALADTLLQESEESGDYLWRLPMWEEYEEATASSFADVANVPGNGASSRYAGATNGGMFLWHFAKELHCPWAHIDIAPRMTTLKGEELAKGASGTPVRLLLRFIECHSQ